MESYRWHTNPQGATAALHAAFKLVDAINQADELDLTDDVLERRDDLVAVLDEHFTFEEVA